MCTQDTASCLTQMAHLLSSVVSTRYSLYITLTKETLTSKVHDTTSEDPAQWKWVLTQSWRSPEPTNIQGSAVLVDMKERASAFASPFREAFMGISDKAPTWHNRLSSWPTKPWDNRGGKITLIGDAAHPMTFRTFDHRTFALLESHQLELLIVYD
jgi:2-polyprenyl-6-methoxyphenol hydroxylase-like FAD-dependent oxidoreductase